MGAVALGLYRLVRKNTSGVLVANRPELELYDRDFRESTKTQQLRHNTSESRYR